MITLVDKNFRFTCLLKFVLLIVTDSVSHNALLIEAFKLG